MPILDATFPVVVAAAELPAHWGFETPYDLPADVAVGMLTHDYVYMSKTHETVGGLKSANIKLPGGRHTAFLKQVARAKQRLRRQEVSMKDAAEEVYTAMASEVMNIAQLVQDYAVDQVVVTLGPAQSDDTGTGATDKNAGISSGRALTRQLTSRCLAQALPDSGFVQWLMRERPDMIASQESEDFYSTLFQTQLCMDLLHREISSIISQRNEDGVFNQGV